GADPRWQTLADHLFTQIHGRRAPLAERQVGEIGHTEPLDQGEQVVGERLPPRIGALVMRGFLVNVSNPKALIFMLAVLPQFVDPHAPLTAQYLIIGATMVSVDLIVMAGYTGLAARVLTLLRTPRQQRITNRVFASLFLAAAALLSTVRRAAV
ncbi:LysE family transporter, partial [uncultured Pseudomonas sp.]|uniref:LysE family transporter n=1 Tax=uncultured Pseudomonas sp. TaxID=114707 RepID=UPI002584366E